MKTEDRKKLIGRLRRIAGQIRAIESAVDQDTERVTNQLLAAIAATKSSLRFYLERELLAKTELSDADRQLIGRLFNRVD